MAEILNGWTEIALFLSRKPRTAQKWERKYYLPIHRAGSGRHSPVFAYRAELTHWLRTRRDNNTDVSAHRVRRAKLDSDALARNRELRTELRSLMGIAKGQVAKLRGVRDAFDRSRFLRPGTLQARQRNNMEKALAETSRRLIEAQEQERARIARELHDDIGQRLALSISATDLMEHSIHEPPEKLLGVVRELRKEVTEVAESIRNLAHDLHAPRLQFLDLSAAMRSLCDEFSGRTKIRVNFTALDMPQLLPPEISLCLFRVLQEALHNAGRHSQASSIDVTLRATPVELHLAIADTGVGFDVSDATRGPGLGLTAIQERVRLLNGTILIRSKPGAGTVIHACVPFQSKSLKALHAKP